MNPSQLTALVAVVRAQIAAGIERDLSMMMQGAADPRTGAKAAAPGHMATPTGPANPPQAQTPQAPAGASIAQVVDSARATAAGRQASMAPLFADLAQALASPDLPAPVRAAVRQILAFQTPLDQAPTGPAIARAVAQSGLFLEAHLAADADSAPPPDLKAALLTLRQALTAPDKATANAAPRAPPQDSLPQPPPTATRTAPTQETATSSQPRPSPSPPTAQALIRGIDQALVRPSAAAPLAADLARAMENPALPSSVRTTIGQVLARLPAPDAASTVQPSATRPAAPSDPRPQFPSAKASPATEDESPPPPELKAALVALRQALVSPERERTPPPAPRAAPAAPPSRDAATAGQPPARASLPARADIGVITEALTRGIDQTVARQTLHQLASLPQDAALAWMFELPLATPQGAAVAQFEIERDTAHSSNLDDPGGWRVRFSIDTEPLGPLHVHLHAGGGRATVNVWAERPASLAPLQSLGGELSRALQADIRFQTGAPSQAVAKPGRFLDAST